MLRVGFILAVSLLAYCTAKWCCGDIDTEVQSKIVVVTKSRTVQVYATEYYKLRTGFRPCPNDTSQDVGDVPTPPPGLGHDSEDTKENKGKLLAWLTKNRDFLWKIGGEEDPLTSNPWCPIYSTKSRPVVAYKTEQYDSAAYDDKNASCEDHKKMCCRGFKQVGDNCVEEKKAGQAAKNLDFLASLGIVG